MKERPITLKIEKLKADFRHALNDTAKNNVPFRERFIKALEEADSACENACKANFISNEGAVIRFWDYISQDYMTDDLRNAVDEHWGDSPYMERVKKLHDETEKISTETNASMAEFCEKFENARKNIYSVSEYVMRNCSNSERWVSVVCGRGSSSEMFIPESVSEDMRNNTYQRLRHELALAFKEAHPTYIIFRFRKRGENTCHVNGFAVNRGDISLIPAKGLEHALKSFPDYSSCNVNMAYEEAPLRRDF